MDDPAPAATDMASIQLTAGEKLACWAIGTFETCLLAATAVLFFFLNGTLNGTAKSLEDAGDLGAITGIVLFVSLWGCTVYSTMRAFREGQLLRLHTGPVDLTVINFAALWGGFNGIFFLGVLVAIAAPVLAGVTIANEGPAGFGAFLLPLFLGLFGALPAFFIGASVGLLLGPIVGLVLYLARAGLPPSIPKIAPR